MPTAEIGERIRIAREAARMTQEELGKRLKRPVTNATIGQWESGRRTGFPTALLDEIADILLTTRDILETGEKEAGPGEEGSSVVPLYNTPSWRVPLVAFQSISSARLNAIMSEAQAKRRFHTTGYPVPNGGLAFKLVDASMEPKIARGSTIAIGFGITPEPEDYVVAEFGGVTVFRRFLYGDDDKILLSPINSGWRKYEFTHAEWEKDVNVIGVMTAFETIGRSPIR